MRRKETREHGMREVEKEEESGKKRMWGKKGKRRMEGGRKKICMDREVEGERKGEEKREARRDRKGGMKRKRGRNKIKLTYTCSFLLLHFRSNRLRDGGSCRDGERRRERRSQLRSLVFQ